ncbi:MAG: DUF1294 domain-containing protein [Oscillospiraceae bacterium]|nr:DUF1294 domain-containing protein [Oscillospiraceae bacterium]
MYAVDKARAAGHGSRVSIAALLTAAFIGGSVGALAAMYILRHKTRKTYFTVGVPLMLLTQLAALFCLINAA